MQKINCKLAKVESRDVNELSKQQMNAFFVKCLNDASELLVGFNEKKIAGQQQYWILIKALVLLLKINQVDKQDMFNHLQFSWDNISVGISEKSPLEEEKKPEKKKRKPKIFGMGR